MEHTRAIQTNNNDRISNLPGPIIHHILSFLETIDVMKTSMVSRKMWCLCNSMPYLNFNIAAFKPTTRTNEKFKEFVNWVLMSRDGSTNIQTFRLSCSVYGGDYTIYRWISVAARRNVQKLHLHIIPLTETPIELPHCLVTCESLVELKLCLNQHVVVKLPSFPGFRKLKSLELEWVEIADLELARKFISRCPLLEVLSMDECNFRVCGSQLLSESEFLVISAKNLKQLKIRNCNFYCNDLSCRGRLEVCCPNLVAFNYIGLLPQNVSLQDLSSLQSADIYINNDRYEDASSFETFGFVMGKFLKGLSNTKALELHVSMQIPYPVLANPGGDSISLHNLKFLRLAMGMFGCYLDSLINLLKCSPNLESLTIHFLQFGSLLFDNDWEIPDMVIACLTYHLKMVELKDVEGIDNQLELIRFLLKNGHVLEKMSVLWHKGLEIQEEMQGVMEFPRSSSCVTLTQLQRKSDYYF